MPSSSDGARGIRPGPTGIIAKVSKRVRVRIVGVDPGIRNVFAAHDTNGHRTSMSSGEFDALAHLEALRTKTAAHVQRACLPRLPRVCRCSTGVLANYEATVLRRLSSFLGVYGHEDLAQAKLTVRGPGARSRAGVAPSACLQSRN